MLGLLVAGWCRLLRRRYAIEMVGDVQEALGMLGWKPAWLGRLVGSAARTVVRGAVRGAVGAAYVTERRLQARYPMAPSAITAHYSSIMLDDDAFARGPRTPVPEATRLVVAASLARPYKGIDVLIDALGLLQAEGLDAELTVVGDGALRPTLERRAEQVTRSGSVSFVGRAPGPRAVREHLDRATVYVQPSLSEGLPRSVIEAMARGLPCVATHVGGMSELLDEELLVPPGDARALARTIRELVTDRALYQRQAARNLSRAADYRLAVLEQRRGAFYRELLALRDACPPITAVRGAK
jgi:glycosyltransferase involved in cell wall biosynthesis